MLSKLSDYEYQLYVYYAQPTGWEHELSESTRKEARERQKEYQENCPQYSTKIIKKRIVK